MVGFAELRKLFQPGCTSHTGASTPLEYDGQYTDAATGLQYLQARYYDPSTGQFLTVDPDVATTLSPYGYVAGDPLNAGDPSGLCGWNPLDWLSCLVPNTIQSQYELAHPTWGQAAQNLLGAAAILNMEDGGGEAIEGCELATEAGASAVNPLGAADNCVSCAISGDSTLSGAELPSELVEIAVEGPLKAETKAV